MQDTLDTFKRLGQRGKPLYVEAAKIMGSVTDVLKAQKPDQSLNPTANFAAL